MLAIATSPNTLFVFIHCPPLLKPEASARNTQLTIELLIREGLDPKDPEPTILDTRRVEDAQREVARYS
jgi:hypothetical protein